MAANGLINGGMQVQPPLNFGGRELKPGGIWAEGRHGSFPQGNMSYFDDPAMAFGAPQPKPLIDIPKLYSQWATRNPHLDPQAAFMAGVDVGMGQVDDFSQMPYDPSAQPEVGTEIDEFQGQFPPAQPGGEFGEQFPAQPGGELGPGFKAEGFVPGGLPGTGIDPNAGMKPERQRGPQVDMTEFGV